MEREDSICLLQGMGSSRSDTFPEDASSLKLTPVVNACSPNLVVGVGQPSELQDVFLLNRKEKVTLQLSKEGFKWGEEEDLPKSNCRLALNEVVAVTHEISTEGCCLGHEVHKLCIHTFERNKKCTSLWKPVHYKFYARNSRNVKMWIERTRAFLAELTERPTRLWVFVNPYGGARKALKIWKQKVLPLFELAGIEWVLHTTEKADEAFESVNLASQSLLEAFDGIIAVGGDGLFQEVMNGLLKRTERPKRSLRIGHIPAGSTDAVAWSINGSRCPVSAALRIIVGDRMPLDVMHVRSDLDNCEKYSACIAGYGFMGDIISISEKLRWFGPMRYDIAGVLTFLTHNHHKARISYIRAHQPDNGQQECRAPCLWCQGRKKREVQQGSDFNAAHSNVEVVEGDFVSVMITVTPCRSDKSPNGLIPHAHLSDGRIHLTLVQSCSRWRYLAFLISLAKHGVVPNKHEFVQTIDAKWARVEPENCNSSWSIDGEFLDDQNITSTVHNGLVEVFARGIEIQE